ncbi:MAG: dihydrofolate reductase [Bacteroidetes bacterium]|nr:dihydrofolate reductase [Bacteroidota bacterium]
MNVQAQNQQTRPAARLSDEGDEPTQMVRGATAFDVMAESFADLQVLRYQVPGFEKLSRSEKQLAYYLYEATLSGRDIIYDQKSKYGILLRKTIETMYGTYRGDKSGREWSQFQDYCGRFWFSNGNHHHYGNEKFIPDCSSDYFKKVIMNCDVKSLPTNTGENIEAFWQRVQPLFYDLKVEPKCVDLRSGIDNVAMSSNNFYEGVTQKEVEDYYNKMSTAGNAPSWGLNSKVVKENGQIKEKVWKSGGMYGAAIDKIIYWLEKATMVAENEKQKTCITLLIKYLKTGDLKTFDDYSIAWVKDTESKIDGINGFIEVYLDAIGKKGSYESYVCIRDEEATKRIAAIAKEAQWFEDQSPLMPQHKKKEVKGIIAKAITVIAESGDLAPTTAIGINLPNADWIRKDHGSKSVSLSNIVQSYNVASAMKGTLDEFGLNNDVKNRIKMYGALSSDLHTDMHECIGHASGQINPGVETTDKTLKNYASCLEEARADLVGLYYIMDKKLIDIGVMPSLEVAKAGYDNYMMNGLMTQLTRIKLGDEIEEAHMRNRQLNAMWAYEKGKKDNVVEFVKQGGKTFVKINDYNKLRTLFGDLLREIQRIKSEGDFKAGQALVENYGVKVDQTLHKEVLDRYSTLGIKPYRGFIQPKLTPVESKNGFVDVKIEYPTSFFAQMLEYGKQYSFLGVKN